MFSKFQSLPPEKKQRIINAAMKEFSENGYKNASTDIMAAGAEISKGALFHYFKSKRDLFLYLYDYSLNIVVEGFFSKIDLSEKDIIKRMENASLLKMDLMKIAPDLFRFIIMANTIREEELIAPIGRENNVGLEQAFQKFLADIDRTKFREDIDVDKALNIIVWTMEGFSLRFQNREMAGIKSLEALDLRPVLEEMKQYFALLRASFYKRDSAIE